MSRKQRGILVKTEDGEKGIYYPDKELINGKYPVTIIDDQLQPKIKSEKPVQKLFTSDKLKPFGFIN